MSETFVFKDPLWFAVWFAVVGVALLRCFKLQRVWVVPFAARWQSPARRRAIDAPAVAAAWLGFALLIAALARPQTRTERTEFGREAYDAMLAVDVSRSMLSEDYEWDGRAVNRLEVLKPIVARFVTSRPRDRIGIVVFSGRAYTLMPPTWNHARLLASFAQLDIARFPPGTAIGDGLVLALRDLALARPAGHTARARAGFVVLMSDGSSNAGLFSAAEAVALAKQRATPIYSIAVGAGEFNIPYLDEHGEKQFEAVRAEVDEGELWTIARETGGGFFRATNAAAIHATFDTIAQRESLNVPVRKVFRAEELFLWFALPGVAFMSLGAVLVRISPAQWERGAKIAGSAFRTMDHAIFYETRLRLEH